MTLLAKRYEAEREIAESLVGPLWRTVWFTQSPTQGRKETKAQSLLKSFAPLRAWRLRVGKNRYACGGDSLLLTFLGMTMMSGVILNGGKR